MITVSEHKKTLEAKGIHLPDAEIEKLLAVQYKFANAFFDLWVKQTNSNIIVARTEITTYSENGNCIAISFTYFPVYAYVTV
jgi:hypothetical protein